MFLVRGGFQKNRPKLNPALFNGPAPNRHLGPVAKATEAALNYIEQRGPLCKTSLVPNLALGDGNSISDGIFIPMQGREHVSDNPTRKGDTETRHNYINIVERKIK